MGVRWRGGVWGGGGLTSNLFGAFGLHCFVARLALAKICNIRNRAKLCDIQSLQSASKSQSNAIKNLRNIIKNNPPSIIKDSPNACQNLQSLAKTLQNAIENLQYFWRTNAWRANSCDINFCRTNSIKSPFTKSHFTKTCAIKSCAIKPRQNICCFFSSTFCPQWADKGGG
ncbi:hypothetical protein [Helicobacter sp. 'CLO3_human']|uniref:hypothetical protein n=1 Tax=Helicobacter sp. 'CLO3_human' TaxID=2020249 RepID=UPI000CF0BD48|nr:hypothetical protein [Helicobacter sp. 'CLO3_human']